MKKTTRLAAFIVAAGTSLVALPMLDAASAAADPDTIACEPGQVVIDGQCVVAPANGVTATQGGTDSVHAPDAAPAAGAGGTEGHGH